MFAASKHSVEFRDRDWTRNKTGLAGIQEKQFEKKPTEILEPDFFSEQPISRQQRTIPKTRWNFLFFPKNSIFRFEKLRFREMARSRKIAIEQLLRRSGPQWLQIEIYEKQRTAN